MFIKEKEREGETTLYYQTLNRVCCRRVEAVVALGVTRARVVGGPKNWIAAACCSSLVIQLSWVATGLSRGVVRMNGPLVIKKECIWLRWEMA